MKVAIISDTHDNTPAIVWIIEYMNEHQISTAFHAGDLINPGNIHRFGEHYKGELHFVFGNNDGDRAMLVQRSGLFKNINCHLEHMDIEFEGKQIYMNHYSAVVEKIAQTQNHDVCVGGHDHTYRVIPFGKTLFINPGNTVTKDKWALKDQDKESSFVILDLETMEHERIMVPTDL